MSRAEFLVLDAVIVTLLLVLWVWGRVEARRRCPAPSPRHGCVLCGRSYLDQRGLAWHRQAEHPPTFCGQP